MTGETGEFGGEVFDLDSFLSQSIEPHLDFTNRDGDGLEVASGVLADETGGVSVEVLGDESGVVGSEVPNPFKVSTPASGDDTTIVEKTASDDAVATATKGLDFMKVISALQASKVLDSFDAIEIEGNETPLALEDVEWDGELFAGLVQDAIEKQVSAKTEHSVDTTGMSDFMRKAIEIDKAGGDVRELLRVSTEIVNPIEGLDMDNEANQTSLYFFELTKMKNLSEADAMALVEVAVSNGSIKDKAEGSKSAVLSVYKKQLEDIEEVARNKENEFKGYADKVKSITKSKGGKFPTDDINKVLLERSGDSTFGIDALFKKALQEPEKAVELAMFLFDPQAYKEKVAAEVGTRVAGSTFKAIKGVKRMHTSDIADKMQKPKDVIDASFLSAI